MLRVDRVSQDDWETFKELRLAALQESPGSFGSSYAEERDQPEAWWRRWIGSDVTDREGAVFVAYLDDRPVGTVSTYKADASSAHLIAMWVKPEARRSGVGRALVETVFDWAVGSKATSVTLESPRTTRRPSGSTRRRAFDSPARSGRCDPTRRSQR